MPFAQQILFYIPGPVLFVIVVGGALLFAMAGLLTVRRLVHHSRLKNHNDVADPMLGALAAIYAILLAFVVVTVWQSFDRSNANVQMESNYLADLYRDSEALSPEFNQKVGVLLREYRQAVVDDEWKTMAKGEMSPRVENIMNKIWACYTTYAPKNSTEQAFFEESVGKLNLFRELRRQRIMDSRTGIHPLLWMVLIVGAISTISFTFFFGTENMHAQIGMALLLALIISIILFTIMSLDFPFTGKVAISSEPFKMAILN